MSRKKYQSY